MNSNLSHVQTPLQSLIEPCKCQLCPRAARSMLLCCQRLQTPQRNSRRWFAGWVWCFFGPQTRRAWGSRSFSWMGVCCWSPNSLWHTWVSLNNEPLLYILLSKRFIMFIATTPAKDYDMQEEYLPSASTAGIDSIPMLVTFRRAIHNETQKP